jgi:hypothetical protein
MASTNVDDLVGVLSNSRFLSALQNVDFQNAIHKLYPPSYEYITTWILIATVVVAAISAILVWKQLRADHERSRRELAMNILRDWSNSLEVETASVLRFVRLLNVEQCEKLEDRKPFTVESSEETAALLKACLVFRFPEVNMDQQFDHNLSNKTITINSIYSGYIRFITAKFLNNLESVMVAWYENIAQPGIIEGQFEFLRKDPKAHLATLRGVIANNNSADGFPCLTRFLENLKPKYSNRPRFADAWPFGRGSNK